MWVPTDDFAQLQLQFADQIQWRDEVIPASSSPIGHAATRP
jgi:hypothetical protein